MNKTYVDTNYFLRYLLSDNKRQSSEVNKLFKDSIKGHKSLLTSDVVLFEIYWVLSSVYSADKKMIVKALRNILKLNFIYIEFRNIWNDALDIFETTNTNTDLEDSYHISFALNRETNIASFDKKLQKKFQEIKKST